jgi:hypothetical protein
MPRGCASSDRTSGLVRTLPRWCPEERVEGARNAGASVSATRPSAMSVGPHELRLVSRDDERHFGIDTAISHPGVARTIPGRIGPSPDTASVWCWSEAPFGRTDAHAPVRRQGVSEIGRPGRGPGGRHASACWRTGYRHGTPSRAVPRSVARSWQGLTVLPPVARTRCGVSRTGAPEPTQRRACAATAIGWLQDARAG